MTRLDSIESQFVDTMPSELAEGTLYISMEYATTVHLCACGCGNKVVLPLSPAEWQMFFDGETVSLTPSIGNWEYPCRSHYWIRDNAIRWAKSWTRAQIEAGRARDATDLDRYHARANASDGDVVGNDKHLSAGRRLIAHVRRALTRQDR